MEAFFLLTDINSSTPIIPLFMIFIENNYLRDCLLSTQGK